MSKKTPIDYLEFYSKVFRWIQFGRLYRQVQETIEKSLSAAPTLQLVQLFQNVQPQSAQEASQEDDENFDAAMDFIISL